MQEILKETPSQTAGPYVHIGLMPQFAGLSHPPNLAGAVARDTAEQRIRLNGLVTDGNGEAVSDVLIEVWQADANGRYHAHENNGFRGWTRVTGDGATGGWSFETIKPGRVDGAAPHIHLWLVARGINLGLCTRLYFGDEPAANATDPTLQQIDGPRRHTLIAQLKPGTVPTYQFDIRLQGQNETVFFDV